MVDGISQKIIDKNRADIRLGNDKGGDKAAPAPDKQPSPAPAGKPSKAAS